MPGTSKVLDLAVGALMIYTSINATDTYIATGTALLGGMYLFPLLMTAGNWVGRKLGTNRSEPRPDQEAVQVMLSYWMDGADKNIEVSVGGTSEKPSPEMLDLIRESHDNGLIGDEVLAEIEDHVES